MMRVLPRWIRPEGKEIDDMATRAIRRPPRLTSKRGVGVLSTSSRSQSRKGIDPVDKLALEK